jgi:hypothetical protein
VYDSPTATEGGCANIDSCLTCDCASPSDVSPPYCAADGVSKCSGDPATIVCNANGNGGI